MEFILVAIIAFALGFFVCSRLDKQPDTQPKSGGGPGEEQDGGGP